MCFRYSSAIELFHQDVGLQTVAVAAGLHHRAAGRRFATHEKRHPQDALVTHSAESTARNFLKLRYVRYRTELVRAKAENVSSDTQ